MTGLLLALVAAAGFGEVEPPAWNVRVEVQMISIAPREALTLIPTLRDRETVESAVARLQKMIADGTATLLACPIVWTPNGERAVCETPEEVRYPSHYFPPLESIGTVGWDKSRLPVLSDSLRGSVPMVFEVRNAGITLEVEPTVGFDGKAIGINIVSQIVRHLGFLKFVNGAFPNGAESHGLQPQFRTAKIDTYLRVPSGKPVLIGSFVVQKPEPHVELFILRATAIHTTDSP